MPSLDNPFRQVPSSALGDDPFWSTVVAEHPGATYALLPPGLPPESATSAPPAQEAEQAQDLHELRAIVARAAGAWRSIEPLVVEAGQSDEPSIGWRGFPGRRRLVIRTSIVGIGRERGIDLIVAIGVRLGSQGWLLRPERLADRSTIHLRDGSEAPVEVTATAGDGATVISVATAPHTDAAPLATALADALAGALVEEVRSWR